MLLDVTVTVSSGGSVTEWVTAIATAGLLVGALVAGVLGWRNLQLLEKNQRLALQPWPTVDTVLPVERAEQLSAVSGERAIDAVLVNAGVGVAKEVLVNGWVFGIPRDHVTREAVSQFSDDCIDRINPLEPQLDSRVGTLGPRKSAQVPMITTRYFNNPTAISEQRYVLVYTVVCRDTLGDKCEVPLDTLTVYPWG